MSPASSERPGPDVPLLADLDAGLLDPAAARSARAAADADPAARAVLDALAATRAELAAVPDPPVPPPLAARWSAALAAEQTRLPVPADGSAEPQPPDTRDQSPNGSAEPPPVPATSAEPQPTVDRTTPTAGGACTLPTASRRGAPVPPGQAGSTPPRRRGRRPAAPTRAPHPRRPHHRTRRTLLRRPAVVAGGLLIAVLVGAGLLHRSAPAVDRPGLVAQGLATVGVRDTGGLDDPTRRAGCLRAVGHDPTAPLLGGRRVTFEGTPAVLLVLGTGALATFDVVVVDPNCGPDGGTLLAATHVNPPK